MRRTALWFLVVTLGCAAPTPEDTRATTSGGQRGARGIARPNSTGPCPPVAKAFRQGVETPNLVTRTDPDFRGVPLPAVERLAIVELRLDAAGLVTDACVLRGVSDAIDARVIDAVRQWRFEPGRVKAGVVFEGEHLRPGDPVPTIMTITVRVPAN